MSADEHLYYEDEIGFYDERELQLIQLRGDLGVTKEDIDDAPKGHWNIRTLTEVIEKETK